MTQKIKEESAIKLQVLAGTKDGKKVYSTVTFSDINKKVSDDDFMELADGMASLQSRPLTNISRVDSATLVEG
ncbi:MAG: DUF1659 domain-containing protein [Anaerovibrio sp.]|uniref:DUF1659 domain-containing protein n=1 Tax=Anaerovibrio sp. TaxID=1872532 RepID=UPI0025C46037|nr:hypothetical protein [Anaerovibrio sp.]MBE6099461.1 DUF1659 domain-containing protein [Anaerovibrio sp.]